MPAEGAAAPEPREAQGNAFQTEFVRNLIEDALDDFREEVRRDVMNLHLEMIKQFQLQQVKFCLFVCQLSWYLFMSLQMEIRSLLQQYSRNEALEEEVMRLREENKRLQKKF